MRNPIQATAMLAVALMAAVFAATASAHEGHKSEPEREAAVEECLGAAPECAPDAPDVHSHELHTPAVVDEAPEPTVLGWLGKFHPPLTHFPIALLVTAAFAECLLIVTRQSGYAQTVAFCVRFGSLAAVVAAVFGWFYAGFRITDDEWVMTAHRWAGTGTATVAALLLLLPNQAQQTDTGRTRFRAVLFASAALVGATGFLGGALLYGIDHYAWGAS